MGEYGYYSYARRDDVKGCKVLMALMVALLLMPVFPVRAEEKATPAEVVGKVREAAVFLQGAGETGLLDFAAPEGKWVWKDTYVWVLKCNDMTDAAHPINPKLVGRNLAGLKDVAGNYLFIQMCEASKKAKGGWVEYWWPKVGEKKPSRKVAFILQVPDSPYQVAAGIYDDTISLEDLNRLTE